MQDKNVAFRLLVIAVLGLGSFVFFPLVFVAAFVAWALFKDLTDPNETDADARFMPRSAVTANDPQWRSYFLRDCESEAERAFLNIMVKVCELVPDKGALRSSKLSMKLQVELPPYRVDFLVDDWLVVEIDGAAYHSSPEAIARDQERDRVLKSRGYWVLRIPAKTVFDTPVQATRDVRGALMSGRPTKITANQQQKQPATRSFGQALASIDKFAMDLNSYVEKSCAVQVAMRRSRETFDLEKTVIDVAMTMAVRRGNIQARRSQDSEYARHYDETYARLRSLLKNDRPIAKNAVPIIFAPMPHESPAIDSEIKDAYRDLLDERSKYFEDVRRRMSGDDRLIALLKHALEELGYPDCWHSISS